MNIVKREFRHNLKSLIIWIGVMFLLTLIYSSEYAAFKDNPELLDLMAEFEQMFQYLGMSIESLFEPAGFVSMLAIYYYIPFSIYSGLLGSSIISKEERAKTAEFLFALPVTRGKVLRSKIVVAALNSLILNVVTIALMVAMMTLYSPNASFYSFMGLLMIGVFITQIIFMALGMLFAAVIKQYKKSGSYTVAILLSTYMLHILVGLSSKIEFLKYFTPFKYFEAAVILEDMKIDLVFVVISTVLITGCITGTFIFYKKRDLYI